MTIIFDALKGKFSSAKGAEKFTADRVSGDGWDAKINPDGSVTCTAKETINGKYYESCLKISTKGIVTITKLHNGTRFQTARFHAKDWPLVGVITLTRGVGKERKAFFKNINFYGEKVSK